MSLRVWLCAVPAAGPLGLAIYVLAGVSLPWAALGVGALGTVGWLFVYLIGGGASRALAQRVRQGAVAGVIATVAYDAARYGLVSVAQMTFRPFHVFELFGRLFVGDGAPRSTAYAVGALYHLTNGTGLGIAFRLLSRTATVANGILWAFALEFCMALLYPRWLRIQALGEFLTVSVVGHAVYGVVLALLCQRSMRGLSSSPNASTLGSANPIGCDQDKP
jgi:hypothetical protein